MRAIRVHAHGGPEAMRLEDMPLPSPGPGQVLVEIKAAGVNLFDTQLRSGLYKRELPLTLGLEGAGIVSALGSGTAGMNAGDRVAFIFAAGTYATHALAPASRVIPLPDTIASRRRRDPVPGADRALSGDLDVRPSVRIELRRPLRRRRRRHSALSDCENPRRRGDRCGVDAAKAEIARAAGADHVVVYADEDFAAVARRVTKGRGVDVVYDAVGLETYIRSMDALRPRGTLALYGEASGLVPPIDPRELLTRKSLYLTRTGLDHYIADRAELLSRTDEIFGWVASAAAETDDFPEVSAGGSSRRASGNRVARHDRQAPGYSMTAKSPPRLPLIDAPDDPLAREEFDKLASRRGILNLHRMMAHAPPLMKASGGMATAFRQAAELGRDVAEIVVLRTAQARQLRLCVSRHVSLARAAGVTEQQIGEIGRWRESSAFSPAQKAALGFAEKARKALRSMTRHLRFCSEVFLRARLSK